MRVIRKLDTIAVIARRSAARTMASNDCPVLYGDDASPPVRFVRMTASLLNIDLDYRLIDVFKGENKTETYKKINPLQKIPALVVGDHRICDSHAITIYLCQSFGNSSLYPEDHMIRASINEMLFFNASTLFPIDSYIYTSYFTPHQWPVGDEKIEQWNSALDHLEYKLNGKSWLVGDKMYLCDLCAICTVTSMAALIPMTDRHSRVLTWMQNFEDIPCFDINKQGIKRLCGFVKERAQLITLP